MEPLVPKTTQKATSEVYKFWFESGGWAFFTIDEAQGSISIQSDWGSYDDMWPRHGRYSIKHFIAEGDIGYFCRNFTRGHDKLFDAEATSKELKKEVIKMRKSHDLDKWEARSLWDELDEAEGCNNDHEYYHHLDNTVHEVFEEIHYSFKYKDHGWVTFLYDSLWPFFVNYIREEIEWKSTSSSSQSEESSSSSTTTASA